VLLPEGLLIKKKKKKRERERERRENLRFSLNTSAPPE